MDKFKQADRKGVPVNPGEDYDHPYPWAVLGSLSAAITTPGPTARGRTAISVLVTALTALELNPPNGLFVGPSDDNPSQPNGAVSYEIRLRSSGNNDDEYVVDILAACGPLASEHYTRKATITGTQGTQLHSGSIYFHDAVVESNDAWFDSADRSIPITARANYIGSYIFNVSGLLSIVFLATTLPRGTLYIDYRRFS